MNKCASKWSTLSEKEKEKYKKKFEEDKMKYKSDLEKVKHFLFLDYNDIVSRPPTAYRLFLNERLREGIEKGLDPKEIRAKASRDWKLMNPEDKQTYEERKKANDESFRTVSGSLSFTAVSDSLTCDVCNSD